MWCFVPNCKNTLGVRFPDGSENQNIWLESLHIKNKQPDENSFICFEHFATEDIYEVITLEGSTEKAVKPGAVPQFCLNESVHENILQHGTSGSKDQDQHLPEPQKLHSVASNENKTINYNNQMILDDDPVLKQVQQLNEGDGTDKNKLNDNDTEKTNENTNLNDNIVLPQVKCRLCRSTEKVVVKLSEILCDKILVAEAINCCIPALKVIPGDKLSQKICNKCLEIIKQFHTFRENCLKIDKNERRKKGDSAICKTESNKRKLIDLIDFNETDHDSDHSLPEIQYRTYPKMHSTLGKYGHLRMKMKPNNEKKSSKKIHCDDGKFLLDSNHDADENLKKMISKVSKSTDIRVFKLDRKNPSSDAISTNKFEIKESPRKIQLVHSLNKRKSYKEINRKTCNLIPTRNITNKSIEEELKKVIEGRMTKEELSVDSVIVRVVSDDESEEKCEIGDVKIVEESNRVKIDAGDKKILLPKGIRIKVPEPFESNKGYLTCSTKLGPLKNEYVFIDGYVFENRLCKGKDRYLRCINPHCLAKATQKIISKGVFENKADVTIPHNHPLSSETEIKKQMFFHIMRKKVESDKNINFKNLYETICQRDPELRHLLPLRNVINELCKPCKPPEIKSFDDFYNAIESDSLNRLQFTSSDHLESQFYQERLFVPEDGSKAVIFANTKTVEEFSSSKLMYVDASFRMESADNFPFHLITMLVWTNESYYPIVFALINKISMDIFKKVFSYVKDTLAPDLHPDEIVTDYECNIYYALSETYYDTHIGGSIFYYTQNLYKKICSLGLARDLETSPFFRNIYHMLLMLPLLPVNTIKDGLTNIEVQAAELAVENLTEALFEHVKVQWIETVTPELFCVHRLENRINENVIAPFKKLRDFLMLTKGKGHKPNITIINVVEKLIELENFLQTAYIDDKRSFGRDLSSAQKKNVLKAWQFIETHPRININVFFTKVLGYIKCMENQLWIWGYYKYNGAYTDELINAANFSIVNTNEIKDMSLEVIDDESQKNYIYQENVENPENTVIVDAVVGPNGEFVISEADAHVVGDPSFLQYV